MAVPYLSNVNDFCDGIETQFFHDPQIPTKQNDFCKGQSTWSVIQNSSDFISSFGAYNATQIKQPLPIAFNLFYPESARFVLVLDVSNSMNTDDRLLRLQQSSARWIMNDIRDGSSLGIVTFSESANQKIQMTKIDNSTRSTLRAITDSLVTESSTCLGAGIRQGLRTISNGLATNLGGTMIFITDGEQSCTTGTDQSYITDPELINDIIKSKVKIITVAFGSKADKNLESLADISNGKSFFVPDGSSVQ